MKYYCKICDRECISVKGLSKHIRITHNIEVKEYYDKYERKENEGYCVVCGNEVKFNRFKYSSKTCSIKCKNLIKFPVTIEFWKIRGYSELDSIIKIKELQTKASKSRKNPRSNTTIEYFMKRGLSRTDAISALRDRQNTRSKSKYIERYGEIDGIKRWTEVNKKWSENIEAQYKAGKFKKTQKSKIFKVTSINELELAENLQNLYNSQLAFGANQLYIYDGTRYYYYDIADKINKKIIEYNGDYWHANPMKYSKTDIVHSNKTAEEIWINDMNKLNILKQLGYEIHIVWESEYINDKSTVLNNCLKFLNGNRL